MAFLTSIASKVPSSIFSASSVILPLAADFVANKIFSRFASSQASFYGSLLVGSLTWTALYRKTSLPILFLRASAALYTAYKLFFYEKMKPTHSNPPMRFSPAQRQISAKKDTLHPSSARIVRMSIDLGKLTTFEIDFGNKYITQVNEEFWKKIRTFEDSCIPEARKRWALPEVIKKTSDIMTECVKAMEELYQDLLNDTKDISDPEERLKKMADLLENQEGPGYYFERFTCDKTHSLITFYRVAREKKFFISCPKAEFAHAKFFSCSLKPEKEDTEPFFQPGTPQFTWRSEYNRIIDLFDPILRHVEDERIPDWAKKDLEETFNPPSHRLPSLRRDIPQF